MRIPGLNGQQVLAAAVLISAVFFLGVKLLNPTPLVIWSTGTDFVIQTEHIGDVYTITDVAIIICASLVVCASALILLFYDQIHIVTSPQPVQTKAPEPEVPLPSPLEERRRKWEAVLPTLKEDQQLIYQSILDADGLIPQSDIVEKTGLSKSNVSRTLDILESMGLIERRRRGMGNIILLK
ncbi:MAG TPA: MarR family transcriptional regulator [Methanospirillum sp.]|uniref:helix-turn-helix transcriptional regulator n=1 Tax=Methanospirillum sp. TaxID=45200 RepID=UPI002C04DF1A|nr:MarR family transcriptional regulator [Methanospirillum sp.]HWQ63391.1 MarR family transcriptional regulator [Methanospirillum sp.]